MQIITMDVTPQMARNFLRCNQSNRPIRRSHVDYLVGIIRRGEWVTTHQGIAVSENGRLLDGQHRLAAIAEAGITCRIAVATGVPEGAYAAMDRGVLRTMADALTEPRLRVDVASMICAVAQISKEGGRTPKPTPDAVRKMVEVFGPDIDFLDAARASRNRTRSSSPVRAAGVIRIGAGAPRDYIAKTYSAFVRLDSSMPPIAMSLVRQIDAAKPGALTNGVNRIELFARAWAMFDPDKRDARRIQIKDPLTSALEAAVIVRRLAGLPAPNGGSKRGTQLHLDAGQETA